MRSTDALVAAFRLRKRHVLLLAVFCLLLFGAVGVAAYFRPGTDTKVLRSALMSSLGGAWDRKLELHLGPIALGALRTASRWANLAPQPRAALNTLRRLDLGIYKMRQDPLSIDHAAVLLEADKAVQRRHWQRILVVAREHELVAVYVAQSGVSTSRVSACVLIIQDRNLVVASVRGNLAPFAGIRTSANRTPDGGWTQGLYVAGRSKAHSVQPMVRGRREGQSAFIGAIGGSAPLRCLGFRSVQSPSSHEFFW